MVVTCERCKTQFQLDEARVPETGVLVRCSRCKHAFVVQRPAATEDEAIENAVAQAVKQSDTPEVTRDLPADPSSRSLFDDEETESDWEFNDDPPLVSDESDELADEPADRQGPVEHAAEPVEHAAEPVKRAERPERAPEPPGRVAEATLDPAGPSSALVAPPRPTPQPSRPAPEPEPLDELGSPGDWDIFDDDDESARAVAAPAPPPRRSAPAPLRRTEDLEPEGSPPNIWAERALNGAGWLVTAVLFAIGLGRGLAAPDAIAVTPSPPAEGVVLEGVRGRWVDNARLGRLFVVSGGLRNTRDVYTPLPPLELSLRDGEDREVGSGISLGTPRPVSTLREGTAEQLRASALPQRLLGPGETRAFEGVAWPLPREAVAFEIRPSRGSG